MKAPAPVKRPRARRKPKGQFHHPDLAEALARAATDVVERSGYAAVSLRDLAVRVGVTQPALYRHFASKEALLAEVAWRGYAGFETSLAAAMERHAAEPLEALAACGRAYVRYAFANPGWFRLFFARISTEGLQRHAPRTIEMPAPRSSALMRESVARIVGPREPGVDDVFRALWALVHGLSVFVVERVFQKVTTDAERIEAADAAIRAHLDCVSAKYPRGV